MQLNNNIIHIFSIVFVILIFQNCAPKKGTVAKTNRDSLKIANRVLTIIPNKKFIVKHFFSDEYNSYDTSALVDSVLFLSKNSKGSIRNNIYIIDSIKLRYRPYHNYSLGSKYSSTFIKNGDTFYIGNVYYLISDYQSEQQAAWADEASSFAKDVNGFIDDVNKIDEDKYDPDVLYFFKPHLENLKEKINYFKNLISKSKPNYTFQQTSDLKLLYNEIATDIDAIKKIKKEPLFKARKYIASCYFETGSSDLNDSFKKSLHKLCDSLLIKATKEINIFESDTFYIALWINGLSDQQIISTESDGIRYKELKGYFGSKKVDNPRTSENLNYLLSIARAEKTASYIKEILKSKANNKGITFQFPDSYMKIKGFGEKNSPNNIKIPCIQSDCKERRAVIISMCYTKLKPID